MSFDTWESYMSVQVVTDAVHKDMFKNFNESLETEKIKRSDKLRQKNREHQTVYKQNGWLHQMRIIKLNNNVRQKERNVRNGKNRNLRKLL